VSAADKLYLASDLPTLIVWGERDPLIPVRHAHEAHERIPGSRLAIFPRTGHFPYRDDPQRFASVLLDFVQTTEPMAADEQRWRNRLRTGPHATGPRIPMNAVQRASVPMDVAPPRESDG
jgi:hypothetical protein